MVKYGFEIKLNNEKLCSAGIEDDYYIVTCNLTAVMRKDDEKAEVAMYVSGLNTVNKNHVMWTDRVLKKGDKVTIEIIDDVFDKPAKITVMDSDEYVLEQKIKYFHRLKEELKEHLKV